MLLLLPNKITNSGWPWFILGFWKHLTLGMGQLLSVLLFSLCTLVLSLYSGILTPSKKKPQTHSHTHTLSKQGCEEPFCRGSLVQASATCSFSHQCLVLSCTSLRQEQRPWWWMNFSPAEQMKDVECCSDIAQATAIPFLAFGLCNCSCVESFPVAPVGEAALVGKLTCVFFTLWKTQSSVGGK